MESSGEKHSTEADDKSKSNGHNNQNMNATDKISRVILHQFARISKAPNPSPFALKLETYFRIVGQAYEVDTSKPQHQQTNKCPWITFMEVAKTSASGSEQEATVPLHTQEVADSSLCIEFIKNRTGHDLNAGLSLSEKAISRAFQKMIEEELFWVLMLWRWVWDKDETATKLMTGDSKLKQFFFSKVVRQKVNKATYWQGLNRLPPEEVMRVGEEDFRAIGDFLADKNFLMGDKPTDVDCALFGLLAQFMYVTPACPLTGFIRDRYPNLEAYCERMKMRAWPDWQEVCEGKDKEKESKHKERTDSVKETPTHGSHDLTNGQHVQPSGDSATSNQESTHFAAIRNDKLETGPDGQIVQDISVVKVSQTTEHPNVESH